MMLSILMAIMAAAIMKMVLHRATVGVQASGGGNAKGGDDGFLADINGIWLTGGVCASAGSVSCTGAAGVCGCTCTDAVNFPSSKLYANPVAGACQITACSPKFPADICP